MLAESPLVVDARLNVDAHIAGRGVGIGKRFAAREGLLPDNIAFRVAADGHIAVRASGEAVRRVVIGVEGNRRADGQAFGNPGKVLGDFEVGIQLASPLVGVTHLIEHRVRVLTGAGRFVTDFSIRIECKK